MVSAAPRKRTVTASPPATPPLPSSYHHQHLVTIHDIPLWLRFNPYILTAYRPSPSSLASCLASFFTWHNETCNVHTHFAGVLFALYVLYSQFSRFADPRGGELCMWGGPCALPPDSHNRSLPVSVNAVIASFSLIVTFFGSTAYHLCMPCCRSRQGYNTLLACDVRGSVVGIAVTGLSFLLKGDPCHPWTVTRVVTTVVFVVAAVVTLAISAYSRNVKQRMVGIGVFVVLRFICAIICLNHKYFIHNRLTSVSWHASSFFLLIIGGWFNMSRVPEKHWPDGRFDCFFNSHNIWHVLSLISGVGCLVGALADDVDWAEIRCVSG